MRAFVFKRWNIYERKCDFGDFAYNKYNIKQVKYVEQNSSTYAHINMKHIYI